MKKETILYTIIGLLVGTLIGIFVTSNVVNNNMTDMMRMIGVRNQSNTTQVPRGSMMSNQMDQHFIEQMIPHHEDAITMAKLAQNKATRPEIKQLANAIIDSQSKEINQMKDWYKDWFGREVPTGDEVMSQHGMMGNSSGMHMGMMGNETDMIRLENADDFDKAFIKEMIPHHQMAVMMAIMLKNGSQRAEMKKLANDIITAQTAEIEQMRLWYSEW